MNPIIPPNKESNQGLHAKIAGFSIVLMALLAGFAYGFVFNTLIVQENPDLTATQIKNSEFLFRTGVYAFLIVLLLDLLVAWALYLFFKASQQNLSLMVALLRFLYAALLGVALFELLPALRLVQNTAYASVLELPQINVLILSHCQAFLDTFSMSLIIFGFHLLLLGYMAFISSGIPKIWGALLIIAGFSYLLIHSTGFLFPAYTQLKSLMESILSIPMIIGELGFGIWLIFKGGRAIL